MHKTMTYHFRLWVGIILVTGGLQSVQVFAQTASPTPTPAVTTAARAKKMAGGGLEIIGAVLKGDLKVLRELLGSGRDPDEANSKGRTALHVAAFFGDLRTARLLLAAGANVNVVDARQITPLILASTDGRLEMVKLLLAQGADPALQDKIGRTAQAAATRGGFTAIVEVLKTAASVGKQKKQVE
ncbi:MAG TPA: ankyrin repeat domain-containing protein [Gammaproteobacteria bacterium]|nr:ankyrin repeat domain-containing protein [Gammaproteobacteria bacterium]